MTARLSVEQQVYRTLMTYWVKHGVIDEGMARAAIAAVQKAEKK